MLTEGRLEQRTGGVRQAWRGRSVFGSVEIKAFCMCAEKDTCFLGKGAVKQSSKQS